MPSTSYTSLPKVPIVPLPEPVGEAEPAIEPAAAKALAEGTGGLAFRPNAPADVTAALQRIARDIRQAYTIGYAPAAAADAGTYHRLRVTARSVDGDVLTVRTRRGYVAERR